MLEKINIKVIKNNRKRMVIKINKTNLNVSVFAPLRMSDKSIYSFLMAHQDWIKSTIERLTAERTELPNKFLYFGKEYDFEISDEFKANLTLIDKLYIRPGLADVNLEINKFYYKMGSGLIYKKLLEISEELDISFNKLTFRNVRSRWGSCSMKKNISINIKLMKAPVEIINYVLIHELCHIKEMNHSADFWSLVAKADPNYKINRKWLRDKGSLLLCDYEIEGLSN